MTTGSSPAASRARKFYRVAVSGYRGSSTRPEIRPEAKGPAVCARGRLAHALLIHDHFQAARAASAKGGRHGYHEKRQRDEHANGGTRLG